MQSLQTTELLSFHPPLLETGVSVGIAPPKDRHTYSRQQLPGGVLAMFMPFDVPSGVFYPEYYGKRAFF
jgi:hypothetical protein